MENIIRDIIRIMVREPLIKEVIKNELDETSSPEDNTLNAIRIDKECNIYLTGPEEKRINIKGHQPKTLYLFYLLLPKGISNKNLSIHKDVLVKIYQLVSGKDDSRQVEVVRLIVNGFLGRKGGISDITHKINNGLREVVSPEILKYYSIRGRKNGDRQILMPKHLIKVENELLVRIGKQIK